MGRTKIDSSGLNKKMKQVFVGAVDDITKLCCDYAADKLQEAYDNRTFQNDTYNLKDSYVWAVYYNGVMQKHGFLGMAEATEPQEYKPFQMVIGRDDAESFLAYYTPRISKGWEIVLGAVAPYAEDLELGAGRRQSEFIVMSYIFDEITRDFGSANVKTFQLNEGIF